MRDDQDPPPKIQDPRVQAAMKKVPRHLFVPPDQQNQAYEDRALSIGFGQTISQPYIVGLMTELLELQGSEKVLEIGTGSGYQAAVLAELAREVYTLEIIPELANTAAERLKKLGYRNIYVRLVDGEQGWSEQAPFDVVIVTCAPEKIPEALTQQLKEGGRLVIPLGGPPTQTLYRMRKEQGRMQEETILAVRFVPMTHSTKER